jgi:hypothetical protein
VGAADGGERRICFTNVSVGAAIAAEFKGSARRAAGALVDACRGCGGARQPTLEYSREAKSDSIIVMASDAPVPLSAVEKVAFSVTSTGQRSRGPVPQKGLKPPRDCSRQPLKLINIKADRITCTQPASPSGQQGAQVREAEKNRPSQCEVRSFALHQRQVAIVRSVGFTKILPGDRMLLDHQHLQNAVR